MCITILYVPLQYQNKQTMENKIKISFKNEFQMEVKSLKIDGDWAYVNVNENSNVYYCRLNSKGVKKNSWRIDITN